MIRQTLLSALALVGTSLLALEAKAKPTTLDCDLSRKVMLGGKVRSQEQVKETVTLDLVEKRLSVGRRSGRYVTAKLDEISMVGLPSGQKVLFGLRDNLLTTFDVSEFGEVVAQSGKCSTRGR